MWKVSLGPASPPILQSVHRQKKLALENYDLVIATHAEIILLSLERKRPRN